MSNLLKIIYSVLLLIYHEISNIAAFLIPIGVTIDVFSTNNIDIQSNILSVDSLYLSFLLSLFFFISSSIASNNFSKFIIDKDIYFYSSLLNKLTIKQKIYWLKSLVVVLSLSLLLSIYVSYLYIFMCVTILFIYLLTISKSILTYLFLKRLIVIEIIGWMILVLSLLILITSSQSYDKHPLIILLLFITIRLFVKNIRTNIFYLIKNFYLITKENK